MKKARTPSLPQATRYTPAELRMLVYWEGMGYTFGPGQRPPMSIDTPPGQDRDVRVVEVLMAALAITASICMLAYWMYTAGDLARTTS